MTVLPEGLEDRFRELRRRPSARAALRADREAAVERIEFGTAYDHWVPDVPLRPRHNEPEPHTVDQPRRDDALAGLDAQGRAVLVRRAFGLRGETPAAVVAHPSEAADTWVISARLLRWDGPRLEIVGLLTHGSVSHVTWVDHDDTGRPLRFATAGVPYNDLGKGAELALCEWEGERCVRVRRQAGDGRWSVDEAEYDEHGLVAVRSEYGVWWQRRFHGAEDDPLPPHEALPAWVEAVAAAAERAGVPDAAVIKVVPRFHDEAPYLVVADRAYLEAAAAHVSPREAIARLWEPRHELIHDIDDAGLRALRSLRQQKVPDDEQPAVAEALLRRLAATRWPGDAVAMVFGIGGDPWALAEAVVPERLAALRGMLPATAPIPRVEHAPSSVDELRDLLGAFGLPSELAQQSAWGLVPAGGGRGRSRLGGRAELPDGLPWPACEGRTLTHLATIDLSELPAFDGRELLPADGDLVYFADLTEEGELWEPAVVGEDDRVRILHIAPGTALHEPAPPRGEYDSPAVLRRRDVAFRPVLTMPEEPAGLDAAQRLAYERFHSAAGRGHARAPGARPPPARPPRGGAVRPARAGADQRAPSRLGRGAAVRVPRRRRPDVLRRRRGRPCRPLGAADGQPRELLGGGRHEAAL